MTEPFLIVCRISRKGQKNTEDIFKQEKLLIDYIEKNFSNVEKKIYKFKHTGSAWREGYEYYHLLKKKLLSIKAMNPGKTIKLFVREPDRLTRSNGHFSLLLKFIKNKGMTVKFYFGKEQFFDLDFTISNQNISISERLNEEIEKGETEGEKFSERSTQAHQRKREELEHNHKTREWIWVNLYDFVKNALPYFHQFGGTNREFYIGVQDSIIHHYDFEISLAEIERYHKMIPSENNFEPGNGLIVCTKCDKMRWVTPTVCDYFNENEDSEFTCNMLQGCKCEYKMMEEESNEIPAQNAMDADEAGPAEEAMGVEEPDPEADKYIIKEILGSRINNGKIEFLVWWKGYQRKKSTWEPEETLQLDVPKLLESYKKRNPHYFIEIMNINGN